MQATGGSPQGSFQTRRDYQSWESEELPGIIPVNSYKTVQVNFAPIPPSGNNPFEEIPFLCGQNSILFTTNSGTNGTLTTEELALAGNGTRPDIDVIPGQVDFGLVTVGCCSDWRRVAIYNSGDGTLDINSLGIMNGSDAGFETTQPTNTSTHQPPLMTPLTPHYTDHPPPTSFRAPHTPPGGRADDARGGTR